MKIETALRLLFVVELAQQHVAALKARPRWEVQAENRLSASLAELFGEAADDVVRQLLALGVLPTNPDDFAAVLAEYTDRTDDLADLLHPATLQAALAGRAFILEEVPSALAAGVDARSFDGDTATLLREQAASSAQIVSERVSAEVLHVLARAVDDGVGIKEAAARVQAYNSGLKDYQARRIARTEIVSTQSTGAYLTEQELGIEFHQWWSARDSRVRDSHKAMHGQIVRVGTLFSNGLRHPGDRSGDGAEWVNCRCRPVPFLMPEGKTAPDARHFTEDDLVDA